MQVLSYALVSCVRLPIGRQVIRIVFAGRWVVGIGHPPAFWIGGGGLLIIRNETLPIHGGIPSLAKQNGITRTYGYMCQCKLRDGVLPISINDVLSLSLTLSGALTELFKRLCAVHSK